MRKWRNIICITIIVTSILLSFNSRNWAFSENNRINQHKHRILSLALLSQESSGNMKARIAFEDAINNIDKIGLKDDELANLYMQLLDYYLGESTGEILSEKITRMGEKIIPYLVEKTHMPLKCEDKYKSRCRENEKERNEIIQRLINAISQGLVLYAEFPKSLKAEHERDLKIIRIFIRDYQSKKGALPDNLDNLKKYCCQEYGYKLKIYSPWFGKQLKYVPQKNGKYILEAGDDKP